MRLLLIRHGESEGNARGIIQGRVDTRLTELGREQAQQTAEALAEHGITEVVSSPLLRARESAEIIAERLGVPLSFDDDLMEYDHGDISGLTREDLAEHFPEIARAGVARPVDGFWPVIPGEEGRSAFVARIERVLARLSEKGGRIAVVTHGGLINAACHVVLGLDYVNKPSTFRSGNGSITEINVDRSGVRILLRQNDTCHIGVPTLPLEA